jgi:hypothetical protein
LKLILLANIVYDIPGSGKNPSGFKQIIGGIVIGLAVVTVDVIKNDEQISYKQEVILNILTNLHAIEIIHVLLEPFVLAFPISFVVAKPGVVVTAQDESVLFKEQYPRLGMKTAAGFMQI